MSVCFPDSLAVPGQILQDSLQLITYEFDQPAFNVAVGHVDHKDVGRRVRKLVVLCEKKKKKKNCDTLHFSYSHIS